MYQGEPAKFSGWFDSIIRIVPQIIPLVTGGHGGAPSGGGPIKGSSATAAFVAQVLGGLDQIASQIAVAPLADRAANASQTMASVSQLVASLSNPAIVEQNAGRLNSGKAQAQTKADAIQQTLYIAVNTVALQNSGTPNISSVGIVQPTAGGPDLNSILLFSAIGIGAVLLLSD